MQRGERGPLVWRARLIRMIQEQANLAISAVVISAH